MNKLFNILVALCLAQIALSNLLFLKKSQAEEFGSNGWITRN
jgi:hypothetical protein